jgi:predicted transcriptional regulator
MICRRRGQPRGTYDVLATFLRICEQGTKRTHVIYRANLSFTMFQEYLQKALRAGLVEESFDRSLTTTAKGRLFLQEYSTVEKLVHDDDNGETDGTMKEDSLNLLIQDDF